MTQSSVADMDVAGVTDAAERAALEAILFTSVDSITLEQLAQTIGADTSKIREWLEQFEQELEAPHRGLQLVAVAGGYRLVTKGGVAEILRRHRQMTAAVRLSKAALETLAIVAYKQPVLRTEVEQIRGVDCAGVLKTLLDYRLIKIVGRREMVGRPIVYGTTREFLEYFGLNALTELPTLKEFEELARHAPVGSDAGSAGSDLDAAGPDAPADDARAAMEQDSPATVGASDRSDECETDYPDGPQRS
jgi:segregation and condensation protein B